MVNANNDRLILLDPFTGGSESQERVSFAALGMKERENLEQWLIKNPQILGEPLLIITTEFADFENSKKRLDILALDKGKKLVILE